MSELLDLGAAQDRLISLARPGPVLDLPVQQALGHYLASDLTARRTQPAHPLSAMDGWAIRGSDMPGPWRIAGESAAGYPYDGTVTAGQAVRISTGAIVPDGADAVLVQEQCTVSASELAFAGDPPRPLNRHIRPVGLDFREGATVLHRGDSVTAGALALAIGAGHATVPVHVPPKIAIIDTGDELVAAGNPLASGQIPASNGPMLMAMLAGMPCDVTGSDPVPDRLDQIIAAFERVADVDLVITSGGASVGDHDLVRPALEAIGAEVDFWRVAIKPGKPIMVAKRGSQVIIGLPGNPVSAFVTAHLFALPYVRALMGASAPLPVMVRQTCTSALPKTGKRAEFIRAEIDAGDIRVLPVQDSGALHAIAHADALIYRPLFAPACEPGTVVEVIHI
ncbi:molybdopterin molybdotransferase MoeA [Croceicoccus bisphenolivorans]|uniref:molybdopterin molybdotransferase MoeA n=1 Tax=Croceicoccus bisphenolivorans TaxID=1783232 RepID=UPI00082AE903|nr:molybdopterin molybdotransferase MoeA [Croceicoccus bisphenolivorans]